ncbi:MAG: hypothetical protein MJK04_27255 [Psychrosphaera sp.]|nr:hypothetical protein [Psychrosphaera sp.]
MTTINIRKIMIILSIATATFLAPASQAFGLRITCVFGYADSANGVHTECNPKDTGCSEPGIYYQQLTLEDCRAQGGRPIEELYW